MIWKDTWNPGLLFSTNISKNPQKLQFGTKGIMLHFNIHTNGVH